MKAQDFSDWLDVMGIKTAVAAADKLGVARETGRRWFKAAMDGDDVPVKPLVALAMTALANNLKPWDQYQR